MRETGKAQSLMNTFKALLSYIRGWSLVSIEDNVRISIVELPVFLQGPGDYLHADKHSAT